MSKGIVGISIPRIVKVIIIWDKVFFKIIVYFNGLISGKKFFLESSHCIDTYIDVFVVVLEIHSSVAFEFYPDEEFI